MKGKFLFGSLIILLTLGQLPSQSFAATPNQKGHYFCISELSTGFKPDKNRADSLGWTYGHFFAKDKYIIHKRNR